jgi:drug/metabolite transporter (DMT)-like permease
MKESLRGGLALIVVAVMIASMGVLVRGLGHLKMGLWQQIDWRVAAAVLFGTLLWVRRRTLRELWNLPAREWRLLAVRAALVYGIHLPLLSMSFLHGKYLDVASAYCFPFPTIFAALFYRETVGWRKAAWLLMSLLGLGVISVQVLPSWHLGHVYAFAAGAAAGLALVMRRSHQPGLSSEAATYAMLLLGALFVVAPTAAYGQMARVTPMDWHAGVFVLLAGALNVACVHLGNYALAGRVSGLQAGSLLTFQIPVAYALSAATGERLSPAEIAGALLLLVSIWGVNLKESTKEPVLEVVLKGTQLKGA